MPGKKTSVWLGEDELAAWKDLQVSLTEIVKRGIAAIREQDEPQLDLTALPAEIRVLRDLVAAIPDEGQVRRIVRDELQRIAGQSHD
jgi:DNA-binding IclR family transcriptional regulator